MNAVIHSIGTALLSTSKPASGKRKFRLNVQLAVDLTFQWILFTSAVMANQDKDMINFVLTTMFRPITSMSLGVLLQDVQRFSLLKNKLTIIDVLFVVSIIAWLVDATIIMVRPVPNIEFHILTEKMIGSFNNL